MSKIKAVVSDFGGVLTTPLMAARTNKDWSANSRTSNSGGRLLSTIGKAPLIRLTTSSVDAEPLLSTVKSAPRTPSFRTTFCCGA